MDDISKVKITQKINKLLVMAANGTPNEQKIALIKAQKLILEHHILEHELGISKTEQIISLKIDAKINCYSAWCLKLSKIISKNFRCIPLYAHRLHHKGKIEICSVLGYESDAVVCKSVMENAFDQIMKQSKITVNYYYRHYGRTKGIKEDYIQSFLKGLEEGYYEQVLSQNKYALVVIVPKAVEEASSKIGSRAIKIRQIEKANNRDVQLFGYNEGRDFALDIKTRSLSN
ncbi:MAG: DUF2786 domain-containing protein [Erysipelotrichaceae bacterium]